MAQIVHDLAPGATISFATALGGEAQMATNIRTLASNGATVIVDDVSYLAEPVFQEGVVGKAVADVSADGVAYFSSAGNSNVVVGGRNVGSYEAPSHRAASCPATVQAIGPYIDCHDFDPGAGVDNGADLTVSAGAKFLMVLGWDQPQFGITTDYDIFLIDSAGTVVAGGADFNVGGSRKAFEAFGVDPVPAAGTYRVVVGRFEGPPARFKTIMVNASGLTAVQWNATNGTDTVGPTIFGHNASRSGATVAAVPYDNASTVEPFSSRGPATHCHGPVVGTTPAAALPACFVEHVDVAATDGTRNSFFGSGGNPWRFYGTSTAAPHAAAVAALQRQAHPCAAPAQVIAAQVASGRPVGPFGQDARGGGLVDAVTAIASTGPCSAFYQAVTPARLLDSRPGLATVDGQSAGIGLRAAGSTTQLQVTGRAGVPGDARAVVLNVTVTEPQGAGYATVWPCGAPRPLASNVNYGPGSTIANEVVVKVGDGGRVCLFTQAATHLVADVAGSMSG